MIIGVISHHLFYILLIRSRPQVLPTLKEKRWHSCANVRRQGSWDHGGSPWSLPTAISKDVESEHRSSVFFAVLQSTDVNCSQSLILFLKAFAPERLQGSWLFSGHLDPNGEVSWQFVKMTLRLMRITLVKITLSALPRKTCLFSALTSMSLRIRLLRGPSKTVKDVLDRLCLMEQNKNSLGKEKLIKRQLEGELRKRTWGRTEPSHELLILITDNFFWKSRDLHLKPLSPSHTSLCSLWWY